jgi:hypothetical protein
LLALASAMLGCERKQPPRIEPERPTSPPATESAAANAPPPPAEPDGLGATPEATRFSIECLDDMTSRACEIRGRVRGVREVEVKFPPERALEVRIEPDDASPCSTPYLRGRSRLFLMHGGARIAGAFVEGATVCGWSTLVHTPGLGYREWEGMIASGSGALLGAWSDYFEDARSELLSSWRFSREGAIDRQSNVDDGTWVQHRQVRIYHGRANAVSTRGSETILRARDGTYLVSATSLLSEAPEPVYVGPWHGFAFSALRVSDGND